MHRDRSLDFLRGTAIFFMIITHAIGVFYNGDNSVIQWISWWGGTVCFTIFLFVFAAVYGLKLHKGSLNTRHELRRAGITLIAYYTIAFWVYVFGVWKFGSMTNVVSDVLAILRLEKLMYFTEFIVAFVLFVVLIALTQQWLRRLLGKPTFAVVAGAGSYVFGAFLYSLTWDGGVLGILKAHLVGNGEIHSFPLLSYMPVVLLGLLWGYWLRKEGYNRWKWARRGGAVLTVIMLVLHVTDWVTPDRFPPTILFLSYGLWFSFVTLSLFNVFEKIKWVERPFFFVGKHAFSFYFLHILLMMPLGLWFAASADVFRLAFLCTTIMLAISGVVMAKTALATN